MSIQPRPVAVGVDGSAANAGALRYAVEEARRAGAPLMLVHVVPDYVPISPMMPLTPADLTETGNAVLSAAEDQVRGLAPDVIVERWLHHGARPVQLAKAAEKARVLVVGRDDRSLLERLLRGDTATGAAARTPVPVVVVPAGWSPTASSGAVLVGVKSPAHASALLEDAFTVAAARGAKMVVLHAWKLPSEYDDIIEARIAAEDWRRRSTPEMEAILTEWRRTYPEVQAEIQVVHDHPAHALVHASAGAGLVVIVRRAHGVPAATHLGGVARAVLRSAHTPVRVVPPETAAELPELVLERAGAIVT